MTSICIHIADGFPILSLSLITEPLRVANRELGAPRFSWTVASDGGALRRSSSGIALETASLPSDPPGAVILLASYQPNRSATAETLAWLRRLDRLGALLGCVDTGALVFAKAGLLRARPAAAHPEAIAGFHRQFPGALFVDRLVDFSPPRFSSAGGVATLDMTLALIGHVAGERVARRVADILTYRPRASGDRPDPLPASVGPEVRDAAALMEAHLGERLSIAEIAKRVGAPPWRLTRLFKGRLRCTPQAYYAQRRLARGRDLLRNSVLPVADVAAACGYDSAEAFARAYRARYGRAPSTDRSLEETGEPQMTAEPARVTGS